MMAGVGYPAYPAGNLLHVPGGKRLKALCINHENRIEIKRKE